MPEVGDAEEPERDSDEPRDEALPLVVTDFRCSEFVASTARDQLAAARGEHVLDPIRLGSIRKRDHPAFRVREDVDGGGVAAV